MSGTSTADEGEGGSSDDGDFEGHDDFDDADGESDGGDDDDDADDDDDDGIGASSVDDEEDGDNEEGEKEEAFDERFLEVKGCKKAEEARVVGEKSKRA